MEKTKTFRSLEEALKNPGEVEALTLFKPRRISNEIGVLKNLKCLSIIHSEIESLPLSIGFLTKLETLVLYDNKLSRLPDLSRLFHLTGLDLSYNCFGTIPEWIAGLPSLKRLNLRGNIELQKLPELFFDFIEEVLIEEEKYPPARLRKEKETCRNVSKGLFERIFSDDEYDYLVIANRIKNVYVV